MGEIADRLCDAHNAALADGQEFLEGCGFSANDDDSHPVHPTILSLQLSIFAAGHDGLHDYNGDDSTLSEVCEELHEYDWTSSEVDDTEPPSKALIEKLTQEREKAANALRRRIEADMYEPSMDDEKCNSKPGDLPLRVG